MQKQMQKFTHIDFNVWNNPMIEELANKLIKYAFVVFLRKSKNANIKRHKFQKSTGNCSR